MTLTESPLRPPSTKPKKSRRKLYWIMGIVATVLVLAVVGAAKGRGSRPINVSTEKAVVKTLTQLVSATGRVQPEIEVKISGEVAGEIIELPIVEGQQVKQGDLLVRIKRDYYEAQVEQDRAQVASAKAAVAQSAAQAEKAELDFAQADSLHQRGLLSETEFAAARSALRVAQASVDSTRANLMRAESALRQSEDYLAKTTILAPRDGTISVLNSKLGERVVATGQFTGTEILRVADLQKMEVRVNVNENDVINVKIGDKARVRVDAFQGREIIGTVREIANTARTAGAATQDEVTNFEVRISVREPELQLRPGMSATADIMTKTVENAVAVPIQSVTTRVKETNQTQEELQAQRDKEKNDRQGAGAAVAVSDAQRREQERLDRENLSRVVFVRDGEIVHQRVVDTGILDHTHIQIVSGLKEGEEIVSGSYGAITRELKEGSKIKVQEPAKKPGAAKTESGAKNS
jgi:HlyD family secretion protein